VPPEELPVIETLAPPVAPRPIVAWLTAMRLPFTTVAVVPFAVGAFLARGAQPYSLPAALLGGLAVLLLCIGCYLLGEVYDQNEDRRTLAHGRSKFAGGTLVVVHGVLAPRAVLLVAAACFAVAAGLGVTIAVLQRSLLLFGLGALGAAAAALYSLPPIRLVARGVGELLIGLCYGWLTLVTGYACATGALPPGSVLAALPIGLSVFNIILVNEFPDFGPDGEAGKRNLLQRVGRPAGAWIYALASLATAVALVAIWSVHRPGSLGHLAAAAPAALLALGLGLVVARGRWRDQAALEPVCALTIVLNHLCSIAVAVLVRWP